MKPHNIVVLVVYGWFLILSNPLVVARTGDARVSAPHWRVDLASTTGPVARIDLLTSDASRQTIMIAFEYGRRCDPMLSKFSVFSGLNPGKPLSIKAIRSGEIQLLINNSTYTWYGAEARYENGREISIGLTNEWFSKFLEGRVARLQFFDINRSAITVPLNGMQNSVARAFELCKKTILG